MNALDDSKSKTILLDCHARWSALLSSSEKHRTVDVLDRLAAHYVREKNYVEAEPLLNESYDLRRRHIGSVHHDTLSTMYQLAKVYLRLQTDNSVEDNFNKATSLLRRCLRAKQIEEYDGHHHVQLEEADVNDHPNTKQSKLILADSEKIMITLAEAYGKYGEEEQAKLLRCIFEIKQQKVLNKDQYTKEMQTIEDEENERELEGLYFDTESTLGVNHAETLDLMSQLADAYLVNMMYDKAEIILKLLLERYLNINGISNNNDTVRTMVKLVNTLTKAKKYVEASHYLSHLKSRDNQSELFIITAVELLARSYVEQGKHQEAIDEFKKVISIYQQTIK